MTVAEAKTAFFEESPVSWMYRQIKINCSHISALIYRKGEKGLELWCELKDGKTNCVYIVKHDNVLPGNDDEGEEDEK